ncbi:MAG: periplasmic protein TonB [Sphingomonadales bacterium]|nr:periplasmic protein TonB [Sphingomonadales bacterium]
MPTTLLLLFLAAAQDPTEPPPIEAPRIRIAAPTEAWPATRSGRPVSAPDWSDARLYPPTALALDQQGRVVVETLVGTDGVPAACRVVSSSGYAELDIGTCNVMTLLRFAPPRDPAGKPVESVFRRGFLWIAFDPTPFGSGRVTARLKLAGGHVTQCTLDQQGAVPPQWPKVACRNIAQELDYYLGGRQRRARGAIVDFQVIPAGSQPLGPAPRTGPPDAEWHSEFSLSGEGEVGDCRKSVDRGFGTPSENQETPCGFFISRTWFEPPEPPAPSTGSYELKVYIDR